MKIIAESLGDIKVNEDLNFGLFGIPRPARDANGTFVLSPEDVMGDMRSIMLSLEDIDKLNLRLKYREEIQKFWSPLVYSVKDNFNTTWVIVPFPEAGKTILYSCNS
jgi:hypothetical protein